MNFVHYFVDATMTNHQTLRYWAWQEIYSLYIWVMDFVIEKSAHTFEFSVLAALLTRALGGTGSSRRRAFFLAVGLTWLYALSDEFHQRFVPGRQADWGDILVDWLAALLGAGVYLYGWVRRRGA